MIDIGVLASGSGSILQALIDGQDEHYRVVVVGSNRATCGALDRAAAANIPTVVVEFPKPIDERGPASAELGAMMRKHGVDLMAHAGFMAILLAPYFDELGVPAVNSHPALLPSFKGAHGVRDALAAGVKVTGVTIHVATAEVDDGPILAQEALAIEPGEDEATLHERLKTVERTLYPAVLRAIARGEFRLPGMA